MMQISGLKEDNKTARVKMCFERHRRMVSVKKLASMNNGSMFQSTVASESMEYSAIFRFSPVVV